MTKYLVDYENVKCDGLYGVDKLNESNEVFIFYSINADRITFDLHNMINASKANIKFYNIDVGSKNALDFQLTTYLGYLIAQCKDDKFVIVTKDKDYDVVISFWKKFGVSISVQTDLNEQIDASNIQYFVEEEVKTVAIEKPMKTTKKAKKSTHSNKKQKTNKEAEVSEVQQVQTNPKLMADVEKLISDHSQAEVVANYIEKYKTKLGLNNALVKVYGTTLGGSLYKSIKPLINDKKGN